MADVVVAASAVPHLQLLLLLLLMLALAADAFALTLFAVPATAAVVFL